MSGMRRDPRDQRVQPQWALAALLDHHGHVFLNEVPPPALGRVHRQRVAHPRARLYLLTAGASLRTASGRPPPPVMTPFGGADGVLRPWSERGTVRRSSTSASR